MSFLGKGVSKRKPVVVRRFSQEPRAMQMDACRCFSRATPKQFLRNPATMQRAEDLDMFENHGHMLYEKNVKQV